jgi:integrase
MIKLLAGTGLRISELTRLKNSNLDLENGFIRLQAHKMKRRRYHEAVIPAPLVPTGRVRHDITPTDGLEINFGTED